MKELAFIKPPPVFIEIGLDSFRALQDDAGLELPLERLNNGRLTAACRENLIARLKTFLKRQKWQLPASALCAIGGSGVSLRRLTLPPAAKEEWQRLLLLQIETEFPLGPEQLAWGCLSLGQPPASGLPAKREFLVAAVKKDALEEYSSVLSECGIKPVFTLAGLARSRFCPQPNGPFAILDLDRRHSEWMGFENNVPAALRIFPWGTENLMATDETLDTVVQSIRNQTTGRTLFLTVAGDQQQPAASLSRKLGDGIECRQIEAGPGPGRSAAILGLKQWAETNGGAPPLTLRIKPRPVEGKIQWSEPALRQRATLAILLLIILLALPYAQAFLLKPFLAHKLDAIQSQAGRLSTIDHELGFLQYLKDNSPPYLDALYLFATAAPPGTRLDTVTMNQRGEVSLSGSMGSFQQVIEFRAKLIQSGFFSNVTVEEQTPAERKVNIRITAQWKSAEARTLLAIGPTADEIARAAAGSTASSVQSLPGGAPSMMPPGALPPKPPEH